MKKETFRIKTKAWNYSIFSVLAIALLFLLGVSV